MRRGNQNVGWDSVMRMTAIHAQTERKRHDRSVRCAENTATEPELGDFAV